MIQDAEDDWKKWEEHSGKFHSFGKRHTEGGKGEVAQNASKKDAAHDILKDHHLMFKGITEDANKVIMKLTPPLTTSCRWRWRLTPLSTSRGS